MTRALLLIVAIAIAFAVARFFVHSTEAVFSGATLFKTGAHAFEFGLFGYSIGKEDWWKYQVVFWVLVAVELAAFGTSGAEIVIR